MSGTVVNYSGTTLNVDIDPSFINTLSGASYSSWELHLATGSTVTYCYDPTTIGSHANGAYPYDYYAWVYDVNDLIAVGAVATTPMMIIASPAFPAKTTRDLIDLARSRPTDINVASAGSGTISHLSGELFKNINSLKWTHVPYKGTGPALADLMGGQVQLMFAPPPPVLGLIKSGKVNLIAVSGATRMSAFPDTPTVLESSETNYSVDNWYGIFVPAKTPREIVQKLSEAIDKALKTPEVITSLTAQGAAPGEMGMNQFPDYVKAEVDKWSAVIKAADVKKD